MTIKRYKDPTDGEDAQWFDARWIVDFAMPIEEYDRIDGLEEIVESLTDGTIESSGFGSGNRDMQLAFAWNDEKKATEAEEFLKVAYKDKLVYIGMYFEPDDEYVKEYGLIVEEG